MSLDTLLEAAKYLDHIQKNDSSDGQRRDRMQNDSLEDNDDVILPSATYHLKVDPNVPISVQFHTYTSCEPMSPMMATSALVSKTANLSTKRNSHQNVGHIVMNDMNITSSIRPSMNTMNTINAITNSYSNNTNHKNRDHSSYSRHREMHKTLEKNRRAHLRHCFEVLKEELPANEYNEKKSSHINIISCAIRYIQHLKRTESELIHQTERLVRTKLRFQSQIAQLRQDLTDESDGPAHGSPLDTHVACLEYEPQLQELSEQSDEEVMIELETGEECYDDETTTTASECADDMGVRETATASKLSRSLANTIIYKCHA